MAEIINSYTEFMPAARFIGKKYGNQDRVQGNFSHLWQEWFQTGRFQALEPLASGEWAEAFPEAGAYIGLMRLKEGAFEYWIGLFTPPETAVPDGFSALDFQGNTQGVCWVKGLESEIYCQEEACLKQLQQEGFEPGTDGDGYQVMLERYQEPRFTRQDEAGRRVLDVVILGQAMEAPIETIEELDPSGLFYCANCRSAGPTKTCAECGHSGTELRGDDPIYLGELPGRLRNALQIAFGATEIPFNALATLGSGFTLSAGDIFESYKIYVPYTRSKEAREAFERVFEINEA